MKKKRFYRAITGADTMWIGSLGPRMFWGIRAIRATNLIFHLHDKNGGCRAANFRHRAQIQTGTVPKKLSCKRGFREVTQRISNDPCHSGVKFEHRKIEQKENEHRNKRESQCCRASSSVKLIFNTEKCKLVKAKLKKAIKHALVVVLYFTLKGPH